MPAEDLVSRVAELGAPFGLERSVKIAEGELVDDRCLLSVHRAAFGSDPLARLAEMATALDMPTSAVDQIAAALDGADIVHFGHEGGAGCEVRKLYFEYATRTRRAMAAGGRDRVLVHLAYKWVRGQSDRVAVTRYSWVPCATRADVESQLLSLLPAQVAPRALRSALHLLARVAPLAERGRLLMMEVEEAGNLRRSCDLNIYDAALRVGGIFDLIETMTREFGVPPARVAAVFGCARGKTLGHLSAGIGRDGEEFVTIYYGVEAH